jgi:serine/threonine-protein kinase
MTQNTPESSDVAPGRVLLGKYRVARVIGQGGMGMVVEARHIALDERVALKFLTPEYATHPEASARFLREARAAIKIKSEHVARVSDVGTLETGAPYMVMEFLEGADLSHMLEKQGVLPVADAIDYIIQASEAIAEAHSYGIVHRDIKPANLFLTKRIDGSPQVKVLDFGISKVTGDSVEALTRTTAAMGSALYMSPEQMQQTRGVDHRTDIYALGVSLYELLAGQQPFFAETLPQLCAAILTGIPTPIREKRPDLPEHLARTIEKAYERDRSARYQSVAELVTALAPYAPPRSQPTIERIARMGGLPIPVAGSAPVATQVLPAGGVAQQGGYGAPAGAMTPPGGYPQAPGAMTPAGGYPAVPGAMTPPGGVHGAVVPGPYNGPASVQAAAAFAGVAGPGGAGNASSPGLSSTTGNTMPAGVPARGGSRVAIVVLAAIALLGGGTGAVVMFKGKGAPAAVATPTETASPTPPAPSATAEAAPAPSASPVASGSPSAAASAEAPAASASAPASAAPAAGKASAGGHKVAAAGAAPTPAPTPAPAAPAAAKPNVLDMR